MGTILGRRYERVGFPAAVTVHNLDSGECFTGESIDLSRGGIGLFTERFIPQGASLRIVVQLPGGRGQAEVHGTVVRARTETGGAVMGISFHTPLTPQLSPELCRVLDRK